MVPPIHSLPSEYLPTSARLVRGTCQTWRHRAMNTRLFAVMTATDGGRAEDGEQRAAEEKEDGSERQGLNEGGRQASALRTGDCGRFLADQSSRGPLPYVDHETSGGHEPDRSKHRTIPDGRSAASSGSVDGRGRSGADGCGSGTRDFTPGD